MKTAKTKEDLIMKTLTILIIICGAIAAKGQDISATNLLWTVSGAKAQSDSASFNYACTFTTRALATATLDWSQNNGQSVATYTVTSVDGQWSDVTQDGQVTYHVQKGKVNGTIVFQRSGGVPSIHLQLLVDTKPDQDYIFSISSITPLN